MVISDSLKWWTIKITRPELGRSRILVKCSQILDLMSLSCLSRVKLGIGFMCSRSD